MDDSFGLGPFQLPRKSQAIARVPGVLQTHPGVATVAGGVAYALEPICTQLGAERAGKLSRETQTRTSRQVPATIQFSIGVEGNLCKAENLGVVAQTPCQAATTVKIGAESARFEGMGMSPTQASIDEPGPGPEKGVAYRDRFDRQNPGMVDLQPFVIRREVQRQKLDFSCGEIVMRWIKAIMVGRADTDQRPRPVIVGATQTHAGSPAQVTRFRRLRGQRCRCGGRR